MKAETRTGSLQVQPMNSSIRCQVFNGNPVPHWIQLAIPGLCCNLHHLPGHNSRPLARNLLSAIFTPPFPCIIRIKIRWAGGWGNNTGKRKKSVKRGFEDFQYSRWEANSSGFRVSPPPPSRSQLSLWYVMGWDAVVAKTWKNKMLSAGGKSTHSCLEVKGGGLNLLKD